MGDNYSATPIIFRGTRYSSIKEAMEETGLSRYLIKKEAEYVNPEDADKFANSGRSPLYPDQMPSREDVISAYTGNVRETAKEIGVTERVMRQLLDHYCIERIDPSTAKIIKSDATKPSKDELARLYERMSVAELLSYYRVGYAKLNRWLHSYGIRKKRRGQTASAKHTLRHRQIRPSYEELLAQYKTHSIHDLSLMYSVDKHVVSNWLEEYSIELEGNVSREEDALYEYCRSLDGTFFHTDRKTIAPKEIDIISHEHRLGIEYCGLYWHSETVGRGKEYHRQKYLLAREKGYKLLTVFESDDISKVKALIRTAVGMNKRVYGRNTSIAVIDRTSARQFHDAHHLSGSIGGKVHVGLYHDEQLLMVGSFGSPRHNRGYEWECNRLTSHSDYTVVGGASKIFSHFFTNWGVRSCITYADLRFGEGSVYEHCGFTRIEDSEPNYFYFKNNDLAVWSRVKFQKHKQRKLLDLYDESASEYQNMVNNGYHRIWDCGNAVYVYESE